MHGLMRVVVALTLAAATTLAVALAFPDWEYVAGWVSALVFRDVLQARWLQRNLDEWWGNGRHQTTPRSGADEH